MYHIEARLTFVAKSLESHPGARIESGVHSVFWLGTLGTSCHMYFRGRNELAPGESCEADLELPFGELSLARSPMQGDVVPIGDTRDRPVFEAVVVSCEQRPAAR